MPNDYDIIDRMPTLNELTNGSSIIDGSSTNGILTEYLKYNGQVFTSKFSSFSEEAQWLINGFDETADGFESSGGTIEFDGDSDLINIFDSDGDIRVKIGHIDTAKYGMQIYNSAGDTILSEFDGDNAHIGGWWINNNYIQGDGATGSATTNFVKLDSQNLRLEIKETNKRVHLGKIESTTEYGIKIWNAAGSGVLAAIHGSTATIGGWSIGTTSLSAGTDADFIGLSTTAGIQLGDSTFSDAEFSVTAAGALKATSGTIAGWDMGTNLLRSATSGKRIELNKAENRVSIFDASNEKVVMGYLTGLAKNPVEGYVSLGYTNYIVDSTAKWTTNVFATATITLTAGTGVGQSRTVSTNTDINIYHVSGGSWNPLPDATTQYAVSSWGDWEVGDYGFWAAAGDQLHIDGDVEYMNGDWIIQHDASYLVKDSNGNTIIRLGTDTGDKGLFLYNTDGDTLAKFHTQGMTMGDTDTEHIVIDSSSMLLNDGLNTHGSIGATSTFGLSTDSGTTFSYPYVEIDSVNSTIELKASDLYKVTLDSSSLSIFGGSATNYARLSSGNLQFVSGDFVNNYTFMQFIPADILNFGTDFIFNQVDGYQDYPSGMNYSIIYLPKMILTYDKTNYTASQGDKDFGYGFSSEGISSASLPSPQGFKPMLRYYKGELNPSVGNNVATINQLKAYFRSSWDFGFYADAEVFSDSGGSSSLGNLDDFDLKIGEWDGTNNNANANSTYVSNFFGTEHHPLLGAWSIFDACDTIEVVRFTLEYRHYANNQLMDIRCTVRVGTRDGSNDYWNEDEFIHLELAPELAVESVNNGGMRTIPYELIFENEGATIPFTGNEVMLFELLITSAVDQYSQTSVNCTVNVRSLVYESLQTFTEQSGTGFADAILVSSAQ